MKRLFSLALLAALTLPSLAQSPSDSLARTRKVTKFVVQGNSLLPDSDLQKVLRAYEGRDLTLDEMKDAAADITSLYQHQGYYLVRAIIPQQPFDSSEVKMSVIESKVGKVTVEGAEHYDADFIRQRFEAGIEDHTFKVGGFTRALSLLNELPDLEVKALVVAADTPGQADFLLQVKDKNPFHIGLDYNNYGTSATGIHRMALNVDAGNLVTQADNLSLRGVVGFPSRNNNFFQVGYTLPVNLEGTTAGFSYANGAFAVSEGLGEILDVRGKSGRRS